MCKHACGRVVGLPTSRAQIADLYRKQNLNRAKTADAAEDDDY
jgi:hypothetical protein